MAGAGHGTKAVVAALLANAGIAIAKFIGFLITRSGSMLAESVHSVADTGNQGLLLYGNKRARRAADVEHQFGYGRVRYFWSFIVALMLFSLGGMFATYEGVEKLRHPHEIESPAVALTILGVGIVLEAFSFRTAVREARPLKGDASWLTFIRRSRLPELPVVLLEDSGALLGLLFAFVAVSASAITDDPVYDALGTLSIGLLLIVIAVFLALEMKSLLIGEAAVEEQQLAIHRAIEDDDSVASVIHLRTQHIGPEELLVAAKVELATELSVTEVADTINRVEAAVREVVPIATLIYLEPDLRRSVAAGT